MTPVKLLSVKDPLAHLRHGLPERSSARSPALMAPWLALGPSLCAERPAPRPVAVPSMVPSSLWGVSVGSDDRGDGLCAAGAKGDEAVAASSGGGWTYSLCFFLGPGFPRTLGSPLPLTAAADLLTPFFLGPSAGGPMAVGCCGAGVPVAGVSGVESDAFSPLEWGATGRMADGAGDTLTSFIGVSSLAKSGWTMARSLCGLTLSMMTRETAVGLTEAGA